MSQQPEGVESRQRMSPSLGEFNEAARLAELNRYDILATPSEPSFDRTTALAARLLQCPVALLSFVAANHQWFKSCHGVHPTQTPRTGSFCSFTIQSGAVMVVPDATQDPRFLHHPLVTAVDGIRFYAGAPLITHRGFPIGTLCIIDYVPRPAGLTLDQIDTLTDLAAIVIHHLETRLALHHAEEVQDTLQTTLASIGDGVITTDLNGKIVFMNPVAEELTGWSQNEARHKPLEEVFVIVNESTRLTTPNPALRALSQGHPVALENHTLLLTRDGRELPIDDSGAPIRRGGATVGSVLIFRDVLKRRLAERALELSEDQFRRTFANTPLGLVLTHLDGRFIESNEAYRKLTGYSSEELHHIRFISLTHPDEIELNRALFQQLIREEIPSYVIEKRIRNKQGATRWVRAHAALLRDAAGNASKVIGIVEDITQTKLAEQRFRFLAESIPQMVWTATAAGLLDYVNAQGTQYFQTSQESLLGAGWLAFVHPDDQAAAARRWTESLQTGANYDTQFRLRRGSDSTWRLHLVRALPLLGDDAKPKQWFGTCTDIEDRHQVARQIDDDRHRWRELLLQAPAAIAIRRGPEHRYEWINSGYASHIGRPPEACIGKTMLEVLPEFKAQAYTQLLDEVYKTGKPYMANEAFVQIDRGNGTLDDAYVNFVYLPTRNADGEIDGVFTHITDVTAMVVARKGVEVSENQFRTLAETIPHLAWMADAEGYIFWYNQRWFDYTGTTPDQMLGWGWQSVHHPDFLPIVLAKFRQALATGQPFEMTFPLRRADGEFRSFLTRMEPITGEQGNVVRWFGTNTDITEQQRTEEQLRRINRDLEEFSYVASHDLQEPLRMVSIYTQLLLKDIHGVKRDTFAAFITEGVKRMDRQIQDLLAFSRLVHTEEIVAGTADLTAAFHEALSDLQLPIEENHATITLASNLPITRGDTHQLAHVFQNVFSNALKYRKPQVPPEVQVTATFNKDYWVIAIRDNGIGFEQQYAERIFGLFKRLHNKEYAGTGLGLAICKRIIERYRGRMWAESIPGQGSTFYFSLPPHR